MPNKTKLVALAAIAALVILPAVTTIVVAAPQNQGGNSILAAQLEPKISVAGNVTKDIIDPSNIFLYTDDNGLNNTLPYYRDGNITFSVYDVHFADNFINKSTAAATEILSSSVLSGDIFYLEDANRIPYILVSLENTSALQSSSLYFVHYKFSVDFSFNSKYYLLLIDKIVYTEGEFTTLQATLVLNALDIAGEDHIIEIKHNVNSTVTSISVIDSGLDSDSKVDDLLIDMSGSVTDVNVIQLAFSLIRDQLNVELVKITSIRLGVQFKTQAALSSSLYKYKIAFRAVNIFNDKVTIGGIVVNSTTISLNSDVISSNVQITKIADAIIPFKFVPSFDTNYDGKELSGSYTWIFSLPSESALSFANVKGNITLPDNYSSIEYAFLNGGDIKSSLSANKYYSFAVTAGTQYVIQLKLIYPADVFDKIVETGSPPAFWAAPRETMEWYFWLIVGFFATILLGFGKGIRERAKQGQRETKAKYKSKVK